MATEYVEENPVDEVLYPSYDEADAALTEQYAQLGSNSQAFTEGIQSQNLSQQDQLKYGFVTLEYNIELLLKMNNIEKSIVVREDNKVQKVKMNVNN